MDPQNSTLREFFNDKQNAFWALVSLGAILLAAVFSLTFHHFDEQFQILEFTAYKLGKTPEAQLRWEYAAAMRPWLQPALYYGICRLWQLVGVESPFFWAFNFRLLSGLLSWTALTLLSWQTQNWLKRSSAPSTLYYWPVQLQAFLWFIPYLSVRTSAETWTADFLILGLALLMHTLHSSDMRRSIRLFSLFGVGLFLGLSAAVRFPSLVFFAGTLSWLLVYRKTSLVGWVLIFLGALLPFGLSSLIDEWGYGYSTFPVWNYAYQNLILGKSHEFGVSPIWAYLYLSSFNFLFFLAFPLTLLVFLAWYRWPKHLMTWIGMTYFIVHSLIAHKESRFMYPIGMMLPFYLPAAFFTHRSGKFQNQITEWLLRFTHSRSFKVLAVINILALVYFVFTPTRKELILQKVIYRTHPQSVTLGKLFTPHPFQFAGMEAGFYRPKDLEIVNFASIDEMENFYHSWCTSQPRATDSLRLLTRGGKSTPQSEFLNSCDIDYESWPEYYLREGKWEQRNAFKSYICPASKCLKN